MAIRLTREEVKEQARLAAALREHEQAVDVQFAALLMALKAVTGPLNIAIRARNLLAKEAAAFAERVHERMRDEFEEKSERWQESDAGQEASGLIEEWDGVDIPEVEEVQIVEPEIEGNEGSSALADLPAEA